jgi:hypothetical protein
MDVSGDAKDDVITVVVDESKSSSAAGVVPKTGAKAEEEVV